MLVLPGSTEPYRILAIDPGTNTLGTAVLDFDLEHQTLTLQHALTFKGNRMMLQYNHVTDVYGERAAKIQSHRDNLVSLMESFQPTAVICESPYIGRFKQAGMALVECLSAIRAAVQHHDPSMPLATVEPQAAKAAVNAAFRGSQKEDVKKGVLALDFLHNPSGIDLTVLDEHSIDAIAVGIYKARLIYGALNEPAI